jgi:hypothetical protein
MKTLSPFFIFSLSICLSAQLLCMDPAISINDFIKIDISNKRKFKECIEHASNTNPQREIRNIKEKFDRSCRKITEQQEDVLLNIKKKYVESDSQWNEYKNIAEKFNEFEEGHKHMAVASSVHDSNVPAAIRLILRKNFEKNGINPQRFNICLHENKSLANSPTINFDYPISINSMKTTEPGNIFIPSCYLKVSIIEQEGLCISMINSISSAAWLYSFMLTLLVNLNRNSFNITKTDQQKFMTLAQNASDLICALKNKDDCKSLKAFYKSNRDGYSPLWLECYKALSKINRLHKTVEWLEKYAI